MRRHPGVLGLVLPLVLALLLAGCDEVADSARLKELVRERLTLAFGPDTFALASLRRQGSGPLSADAGGRARRIVYYNAELRLQRDLDFSAWGSLNASAFADLLGATERGIDGIRQGGNTAGDLVRVRGSLAFVQDGDAWTPVEIPHPGPAAASTYGSAGGSGESKRIVQQIRSLFERQTANPELQRQIVTEELDHAYRAITLRLDRLDRALLIASGPPDGQYQAVARLLGQTLVAQGRAATVLETQGSAENIGLLRAGQADLALVQSNVAEAAQMGSGSFAADGPFYQLRALASLFPEPVHVLVPSDSPIRGLADLAGKRVELGAPGSGSRVNALMLLESVGLGLQDLAESRGDGLERGIDSMAAGQLDAVIATVGVPAPSIRNAAAAGQVRLLSLSRGLQEAIANRDPGLIPLDLPVASYPRQRIPVRTVAATALLVAPETLPTGDVDMALGALFDRIDYVRAGVAAGSQIERASANRGVTVPLHPAALRQLQAARDSPDATSHRAP